MICKRIRKRSSRVRRAGLISLARDERARVLGRVDRFDSGEPVGYVAHDRYESLPSSTSQSGFPHSDGAKLVPYELRRRQSFAIRVAIDFRVANN
jgi:hypothetical protein